MLKVNQFHLSFHMPLDIFKHDYRKMCIMFLFLLLKIGRVFEFAHNTCPDVQLSSNMTHVKGSKVYTIDPSIKDLMLLLHPVSHHTSCSASFLAAHEPIISFSLLVIA